MGYGNGEKQNAKGGGGGVVGKPGRPGVGFKLTSDGNFDLDKKKLTNVGVATGGNEAVTKSQLDQKPDSSSVLLLNRQNHMTGDLDLRGNKLILPGEINMNRKLIKNLDTDETDDLSAVNMAALKKFSSTSADIDLQDKFNIKNSKQQSFAHLAANYDNLVSYSDVKNIFHSRKETFPMQTALDMGNQTIFNVKDPTIADQGVNKKYVDAEVQKIGQRTTANETEINRVKTDVNHDLILLKVKKLSLSCGTMTGDLDMGAKKITNLAVPTLNSAAATLKTVRDEIQNHIGRPVLAADLNMTTHKIKNLGTPTANTDAATKKYVDDGHFLASGGTENVFLYLI